MFLSKKSHQNSQTFFQQKIKEYQNGEEWGKMKAPRANRFIITHDKTNSMLLAVEDLHEKLERFDPQLFIISGVHMLESAEDDYRVKRVEEICHKVSEIKREVPVHLELASMGDPLFIKEVAYKIVPYIDSLGLNEDELGHLYLQLGGSQLSIEDFHSPSVATVEKALKYVLSSTSSFTDIPSHVNKRRLSRIHFHCLEFHVIVVLNSPSSSSFYHWQDNHVVSVVSASQAVSTRACNVTELQEEEMELRASLTFKLSDENFVNISPLFPFFDWSSKLDNSDSNIHYYFTPVLVCKFPRKTVGCGDTVSSTGLIYSLGTSQNQKDEL